MDFKSLGNAIGSFAPTLATMLGGPLAGEAVSALAGALGLKPDATPEDITKVVQTSAITSDQIVAVRKADQDYQLKLKQLDFDLTKLNSDAETAFNAAVISDVGDARKIGSGNIMTMWIGIAILLSFLLAMCLVLLGCWGLITGSLKVNDAGTFAAVTGLVGAIVGYFASNAQTVVQFLFGGSLGGRKSADHLAEATAQLGHSLGRAAAAQNTPS